MAKKTQTVQQQPGFRSFKNDGSGFAELKEGESITGIFLGRRKQVIKDRRTKQPKEIWVYRLLPKDGGSIIKVGGRALLDSMYEDMIDEMFGSNEEAAKGVEMIINRGDNVKTGDNNPMGTYEILVSEDIPAQHD